MLCKRVVSVLSPLSLFSRGGSHICKMLAYKLQIPSSFISELHSIQMFLTFQRKAGKVSMFGY